MVLYHHNKVNIILFGISILSFIAFVVSCTTYWYEIKYDSAQDTSTSIYYKFNRIKNVIVIDGSVLTTSYMDTDDSLGFHNTYRLYNFGFACSFLSAFFNFILFILIAISMSSSHHEHHRLKLANRVVPVLISLISIIGWVSFIFLPIAREKDCKDILLPSDICDQYPGFIDSQSQLGGTTHYHPYTGWASLLIGSFFSLVVSFLQGRFHHHGYSRI